MPPLTLIIGNKNYSSWSLRPWLVLKQSGLDFEEIRIPLDQPETRDRILHYSPTGRVPVLLHGDLILWESLAICEYLAELVPDRALWPVEQSTRAVARTVSHEMHAGFGRLRTHMPMDCRSRYPGQGMAAGVREDVDRILTLWNSCRQTYGQGGNFLFGNFTIADAMFAPVVSRFVTYNVRLDAVSQAYADAIWSIPAMQEWLLAAAAETEIITTPL